MRPLIPFLLLCLLAVNPVEAQRGARVGYIDMDIILENISEYKKASLLLDQRIEEWKKEIELKKIELKQLQDQLNAERVLLTPELIADRELEIKDFAGEVVNLQEKRFGPRGDRITQRNLLLKPIQDQVLTVVRTIAREKKYDYIFDRSADIVMLYSSKNYDISDLVLKRINAQQKLKARKEKLKALKEKIDN
ncbi:MAG: OmpH family outer membrane protein [Flavobacteriaceae bacterium]|jgi:Skp family chaperone for outer membrane proteins|nr:OmpH family outer membrane protein [Flavobacteriales bacterium]MDG1271999.1 OmpH family outer membrane protein [Flavobacteriaceae bacterium]